MRVWVLAVSVSLILGCSSASKQRVKQEARPRIISLKEELGEYASQVASQGSQADPGFIQKHQRVYDQLVYREIQSEPKKIEARVTRLVSFLAGDENRRKMLAAFEQLEKSAPELIDRFRAHFPRADYDYQVYFLPSLLQFPGRAGFLDDTSVAVAFGADSIAKNNEKVEVLFAHEMFHALHFKTLKVNQKSQIEMETRALAALWLEGFASYVSALVTGVEPTPSVVFGKLGVLCEKSKSALTSKFLQSARTRPVFDEALMDQWFGSGDDKNDIPPMAAYCVGMWAVRDLSRTHSIQELLTWNPLEKRSEIERALQGL